MVLLSFIFVPTVKHKQLDSKELGPEDFEDAIKKILKVTEESDLDKLVRNFLQSKSLLEQLEGQWQLCLFNSN